MNGGPLLFCMFVRGARKVPQVFYLSAYWRRTFDLAHVEHAAVPVTWGFAPVCSAPCQQLLLVIVARFSWEHGRSPLLRSNRLGTPWPASRLWTIDREAGSVRIRDSLMRLKWPVSTPISTLASIASALVGFQIPAAA